MKWKRHKADYSGLNWGLPNWKNQLSHEKLSEKHKNIKTKDKKYRRVRYEEYIFKRLSIHVIGVLREEIIEVIFK